MWPEKLKVKSWPKQRNKGHYLRQIYKVHLQKKIKMCLKLSYNLEKKNSKN